MSIVILQDSVFDKGVGFPAGMIVNIPEKELVELIQRRLRLESDSEPYKSNRQRGRPRKVAMI